MSFGDIFDHCAIAVVAASSGKRPQGGPGLLIRPGLSPYPTQRYAFDLEVHASLQGKVGSGQRITVVGYETGGILTGPPKGICGPAGSLGIYFAREEQGGLRTMVDEYRTWIPLEPRTDLSMIVLGDIPLTVWRLLLSPYIAGAEPAEDINFAEIYVETGFRLGRLRTIGLLSDLEGTPSRPDLESAACIELNQTYRGLGVEGCIDRVLNGPYSHSLPLKQRNSLIWERSKVAASDSRVRLALSTGTIHSFGEEIAGTDDPSETVKLLEFLTKHPDPEIRRLAAHRLSQWRGAGR